MNDKELTNKITQFGVAWEVARQIVGLIVEERQLADRQGYQRGYEDGYNYQGER